MNIATTLAKLIHASLLLFVVLMVPTVAAATVSTPVIGEWITAAVAKATPKQSYIVVLADDATVPAVKAPVAAAPSAQNNTLTAGRTAAQPVVKPRGAITVQQEYQNTVHGFAAQLSAAEVESLKSDPRVAYVAPDRILTPVEQTISTGLRRSFVLNNALTGAGVQVAVLDTGISTTHPDLKGVVVGGKGCTAGTAYNTDTYNHGTSVAGIIAALDNTIGVRGVAPQAKLWSVRVCTPYGPCPESAIICGLDFIASKGPANGGPIRVANISLGGSGQSDNDCGKTNQDPFHAAICRARDAGITIVVAAGNFGLDASAAIPAAYDDAVITVGSFTDYDGLPGGLERRPVNDVDDQRTPFTNFGSVVDIFAPGVEIYTTSAPNTYKLFSGTSAATPFVAGAAALYLQAHPNATWTEVRDALVASSDLGLNLVDRELNIAKLLPEFEKRPLVLTAPQTIQAGQPFTLTWTPPVPIPDGMTLAFKLASKERGIAQGEYLCARSLGSTADAFRTVNAALGTVEISSDWSTCGGGYYAADTASALARPGKGAGPAADYVLSAVWVPAVLPAKCDNACLNTNSKKISVISSVSSITVQAADPGTVAPPPPNRSIVTLPNASSTLEVGQAFTLTWTPPTVPTGKTLAFKLASKQNGNAGGSYLCASSLGAFDRANRTVNPALGEVVVSADWGRCGGGYYYGATLAKADKSAFREGDDYQIIPMLVPKTVPDSCDAVCINKIQAQVTALEATAARIQILNSTQ